jgi:chromosome segregation ATPase
MARLLLLLPLALSSTFLRTQRVDMQAAVMAPSASFDKVLTLLSNLVSQMEAEASADEADYQAFMTWFKDQESATSGTITALSAKLTELSAALTELRARQSSLTTEVNGLNADLDRENGALNEATEKRNTEHDAFVKEQLDFDNAIAACHKAADMLTQYYGDGKPKESTKPAWMTLMSLMHTISKAGKRHGKLLPAFVQQPVDFFNADGSSLHNEHVDSTGDAVNIVSEVQALAETFGEDKESSVEQEQSLSDAFTTLSNQKQALIGSITKQRNEQQSALTSTSQAVSEHEGAESIASQTLTSEQSYLTNLGKQEETTTALYEQRSKDREAEKTAVADARKILQEQAPSLMQLRKAAKRQAAAMLQVSRAKQSGCRNCGKAAQLLKERASRFHSKLLATAGETLAGKSGGKDAPSQKSLSLASSKNQLAMGGSADTLQPVVDQLKDLIVRLDQQAESEQKHKDWCDKERSSTNARKQHHAGLVSEFTKEAEDTKQQIEDKLIAVQDNADAVTKADGDYADLKEIRGKAHADYEAELQDYNDAISALGEATSMLTQFYSEGSPSMLLQIEQAPTVPGASAKSEAPDMMTVYESKGGPAGVLAVLQETRKSFEDGKAALEGTETAQANEFSESTTAYQTSRNALVDAGNALTAELQTAQQTLTTAESNLDTSRAEVTAADNYLTQVSSSCDSLEAHFDDRKSLREQERQAITDAIDVLNSP